MHPNSLKTSSLLLGAALAGLAGVSTEVEAATVVAETTDFSNTLATPTDLTATWGNFVTSGGIAGAIAPGTSDTVDYIKVSAPANTPVSIPFTATATSSNTYFGLNVIDGVSYLIGTYLPDMMVPGETYDGVLSFTMPASGQVTFGTSYEGGSGSTINYTIGATVPEAGSSMLGLAGMAAAALRRRRKNS